MHQEKKVPDEMLVTLKDIRNNKSSRMEISRLVITALAGVAIPIAIFLAGKAIEKSLKDRELAAKYIEISVGILTEAPTPETKNLREWAIANITKYSKIKLNKQSIEELKTESLPKTVRESLPQAKNYTIPDDERKVEYIIVTDSENPSLQSAINVVSKPGARASYHYLIGVDGQIEKIVEEENIAWHAGISEWEGKTNLNSISIGIGLVHLATKNGVNWLNLPKEHPAVGPNYSPAQIDALVGLLTDISQRHNLSVDRILTKQDIAPDRRRTDLHGSGIETVRARVKALLDTKMN